MKARARAIALRRRKDPNPSWLPWLVLLIALIASLATAHAQTVAPARPAPDSSGPQMAVPERTPEPSRDHGVARPPQNVDPGIHVPAPSSERGAMPVIPPPGTPGGNQEVIPK